MRPSLASITAYVLCTTLPTSQHDYGLWSLPILSPNHAFSAGIQANVRSGIDRPLMDFIDPSDAVPSGSGPNQFAVGVCKVRIYVSLF